MHLHKISPDEFSRKRPSQGWLKDLEEKLDYKVSVMDIDMKIIAIPAPYDSFKGEPKTYFDEIDDLSIACVNEGNRALSLAATEGRVPEGISKHYRVQHEIFTSSQVITNQARNDNYVIQSLILDRNTVGMAVSIKDSSMDVHNMTVHIDAIFDEFHIATIVRTKNRLVYLVRSTEKGLGFQKTIRLSTQGLEDTIDFLVRLYGTLLETDIRNIGACWLPFFEAFLFLKLLNKTNGTDFIIDQYKKRENVFA